MHFHLRELPLPTEVPGRAFLAAMPGRHEPLSEAWDAFRAVGGAGIVCLAELQEIQAKSPSYHLQLTTGAVPFTVRAFAIRDYDAPSDAESFAEHVRSTAVRLRGGSVELVHCAAGIGRTGLYATLLLSALGLAPASARARVRAAGSHPESGEQEALVRLLSRG